MRDQGGTVVSPRRSTSQETVIRAGRLAKGGTYPVVFAPRVEGSEKLCPRSIPAANCPLGRSLDDRVLGFLILGTDATAAFGPASARIAWAAC